ncbi:MULTISPECIES: helix-turn-helix domain-containing protein [Photorhabdus]|uniref:Transcriptional regulator n=1 Tax=Photorhabdus tasmaniensis TaxID=1004159 RepID=A0ABX0GMY5_9GAMM|nr:helix-turn-helix domain-containing protein [Photorhabdus tasmaniensis]NHB89571.1 transcriptional regulator [Photorhabdus tasmaniensis]
MKTYESVGARLKRLRNQRKMSQAALAEQCGWASQSRIGNYESGTRNVSADDAVILSKALGVSPSELMFGDNTESQQGSEVSEICTELSKRQKILLELFDELPDSEADELLKTLEEKKRYYNQLLEELSQKKSKKKA